MQQMDHNTILLDSVWSDDQKLYLWIHNEQFKKDIFFKILNSRTVDNYSFYGFKKIITIVIFIQQFIQTDEFLKFSEI